MLVCPRHTALNQIEPNKHMTTTTPNIALLVGFNLTGTAKSGYRITACRDEGMISDGMFSTYQHYKKFDTLQEAQQMLNRIEKTAHHCPRYASLGHACDLAHWKCISGVFA